MSLRHALAVVEANGGRVDGESVVIPVREPSLLPLEVSFQGLRPVERRTLLRDLRSELELDFEGCGFAVNGGPSDRGGRPESTPGRGLARRHSARDGRPADRTTMTAGTRRSGLTASATGATASGSC